MSTVDISNNIGRITAFTTFGSGKFANSMRRITEEAKSFNYFDSIVPHNDESIKELDNYAMIEQFINKYKTHRGYAYWIWKPFIILDILNKLNENDYLLFADAGCHLNIGGKKTLDIYKKAIADKYDVLCFQMKHLPEHNWTKEVVFTHFDVINNKDVTHTGQIIGGIKFFRKTPTSVDFVKRWLETCLTGDLVTDAPCERKFDHLQFRAHRHDQSVSSVLHKLYPRSCIIADTTFAEDGDWSKLSKIPVQARRLR